MAAMSNMSPQALAAWEQLNATWGKPLTVNSAYRDPAQNAAAGGAKRSQHMHGNAFDVSTAGLSPADRAALVQAANSAGFTGYGGYNNSLHLDVGPRRTWGADYTGATTPDWLTSALGGNAPAMQGRVSTQGSQPMTPTQQAPQGILEMMGIQKRDPSAQDQTALPFYQRDQFKNTMGNIAMAANTLRQRPDDNITAQVQSNRQQRADSQSRNKTVEYLRANGREDLASMVEQGMISGKDAAGVMLAKPEAVKPTSDIQNYEYYRAQELSEGRTPLPIAAWSIMDEQATLPGPDSGKFGEASAKFIVEDAGVLASAGQTAARSLRQLDVLEAALATTAGGTVTGVQSWLGGLGIETEGLNEIQLAEAIISQLVPAQRPPGSGTMSDADLNLFKKSLPRLMNTPGGNTMIIATMRSIANYDVQMGNISRQLILSEITPRQAYDAYAAIPDPMVDFVASLGGSTAKTASGPAPGDVVDGYRFMGGDPATQSNWEAI